MSKLTAVSALKVGNGAEDGVTQGPLIDEAAIDKIEELVQDARDKGAQIITGGKRSTLDHGFYEPTILGDAQPGMRIAKEEAFGPIAPVFRFQTEEEAIHLANDTEFGLAAYICAWEFEKGKKMTMATPVNRFKVALTQEQAQIGLWISLGSAYSAEICAGAGFDWLLIDGEHGPNDTLTLLAQLQAVAPYPASHPVARVPMGHGEIGEMLIKQYLDVGVQTLLVPMVDTAEQASRVVRATRYPQNDGKGGIRGMGGARASAWGRRAHYYHEANAQLCVLVQVESLEGLNNLDAIADTEGVDGVFIGPADLSAAMGHVGDPGHPDVQASISDAIARIQKAGKAAGILTPNETLARTYLELGCTFVAVGLDTSLLVQATSQLASRFKNNAAVAQGGVY